MNDLESLNSTNSRLERIQIREFVLDGVGTEVAVFFLTTVFMLFYYLNKVNGKVLRVHLLIISEKFELISNPTLVKIVSRLLQITVFILIALPVLIIIVWGIALIVSETMYDNDPVGGIGLMLFSLAFFLFSFGYSKIHWNSFNFTWEINFSLVVGFLLYLAYQLWIILYEDEENSFFGYSSIFMNLNVMILLFLIYLHQGKKGASIMSFIQEKLPLGEPREKERYGSLKDEIAEDMGNDQYEVTYHEILDLFTVLNVKNRRIITAFGGGISEKFKSIQSVCWKRFIQFLLYGISVGVLIIYAFIIYWKEDDSYHGFVILAAVIAGDFILWLMYLGRIMSSTLYLTITAIINRFFLIIFGSEYWLYGYMVVYLFYCVNLIMVIGNKRFPFENEFQELNLHSIFKKQSKYVDVSKVPEGLYMAVNCIFALVVGILVITEPEGVPLTNMEIGDTDFNYYVIAILAFILQLIFGCLYFLMRAFIRKKKEMRSTTIYYFKYERIDTYWMLAFGSFIGVTLIGLLGYWAIDSLSFFITCTVGSAYAILFLNATLHFAMNEYSYLQDVNELNDKIKAHNRRVEKVQEKTKEIKKAILTGQMTKEIGGMAGTLAKDIASKNKTIRKEQKRVAKKAEEDAKQKQLESSKQTFSASKSPPKQARKQELTSSAFNQSSGSPQVKPPQQQQQQQQQKQESNSGRDNDEELIRQEMRQYDEFEGGEKEELKSPEKDPSNNYNSALSGPIGGSALQNLAQNDDDDDDDDDDNEMINPDEALQYEDEANRFLNKKMNYIVDWRKTMSPVGAYFKGHLRSNDYQIINSLIACIILLIIMGGSICIEQRAIVGVTVAVPFLHYGLAVFSYLRVLNTLSPMSPAEAIIFFSAYLVQYGWGVAYYFIEYYDNESYDDETRGLYIVGYLIVIPFITSVVSAIFKWLDESKFTVMFLVQAVISILQAVGMLVICFAYLSLTSGIIISVVIALILYGMFQMWIYINNDYWIPRFWTIVNVGLAACIVIAPIIASLFIEDLYSYVAISMGVWALSAFLFLYGAMELYTDIKMIDNKPLFYSSMVFPVYKFEPKKNDIDPRNAPAVALLMSMIIMILWSGSCTVWVAPYYIGVSLGILFELMLIVTVLYLITITQSELRENMQNIDKKISKMAWLDSKANYVNITNAECKSDLLTYEKAHKRRGHFRNFVRVKEGRKGLSFDEILSNIQLKQDEEIDLSWLAGQEEEMENKVLRYQKMFEVERQLHAAFIGELELLVQFLLLIIQISESMQAAERKLLFQFLADKKAPLYAMGICINIPVQGSMKVRYARVVTQIQRLNPEQQTFFNQLREKYVEEQRELEMHRKMRALEEEKKAREREEQQKKMSDEQRRLLEELEKNPNMPIDEMPDCLQKWKKILEKGEKYQDKGWSHLDEDKVLGPHGRYFYVAKWMSISEEDKENKYHLYIGDADALDVQQGVIGDCYYMSAISVIGSDYIRNQVIVTKEEEWRKVGAFCVRFFRNGYEQYVIIDDYFPRAGNGSSIFATGGEDGFELWPTVLEKAYAKLYGNFTMIEGGKVQNALSDLTNGFPDALSLATYGNNVNLLWEKLKVSKRFGDLMGAGSHSHPEGDRHTSETGIVAGHAYAVLDIAEDGSNRLIKLRNPHGVRNTTAEWNGDWSDDSDKWTQRMRNKLNHPKRVLKEGEVAKNDGIFWMDVQDFVTHYANLYICRTLDGWKKFMIEDEWTGPSAQGLPNSKNKNKRPDMTLIPQYEVIVNKPCDGFVAIQQMNAIDTYRGELSTFFAMLKLDGGKVSAIQQLTKANVVAKSDVTNSLVNTAECDFDKTVRYPYKFTLLATNTQCDPEGEAKFILKVYSTDQGMVIRRMNPVGNECEIKQI